MSRSFVFENVTEALPTLAAYVMGGDEVGSRLGERTRERTIVQTTIKDPLDRTQRHPFRNPSLPAQIAETMWLLAGRNDIQWLKQYLPRALDFSDDGDTWRGAYGPRIRRWAPSTSARVCMLPRGALSTPYLVNPGGLDQLGFVIDLLRHDPGTRRAVINIYDPISDSRPGKDVPCNDWLHFISRAGELDLHVAVRSNDLIWGWSGINTFEWSVLLEIVAKMTGMWVGRLHFSTSSLHVYDRHWTLADKIAKHTPGSVGPVGDDPLFCGDLEEWRVKPVADLDKLIIQWFDTESELRNNPERVRENYEEIQQMEDPLFRSWLMAIAWWWSGAEIYLNALQGTSYHSAILHSPNNPVTKKQEGFSKGFVTEVQMGVFAPLAKLHAEKSAAYGDSWKKRGEFFSIIPNIARKVDRIEIGKDTFDESQLDTVGDLLVYLIKYERWIAEHRQGMSPSNVTEDEQSWLESRLKAIVDGWPNGAGDDRRTLRGAIIAAFERIVELSTDSVTSANSYRGHVGALTVLVARLYEREKVLADNAVRPWKGYGDGS